MISSDYMLQTIMNLDSTNHKSRFRAFLEQKVIKSFSFFDGARKSLQALQQ